MNCKPGVLAYIVRSQFPESIGRVVTVLRLAELTDEYESGVWWEVRCEDMLPFSWHGEPDEIVGGYDHEIDVLDSDLRPISGVPVEDEQHDEVPA